MLELVDTISAALSSGTNPVTAMRDAFGYSLEELAVTSGLATSELADLENGGADPAKLARLASALGLPESLVA
ncbi:helix-turn-helix domain-containing protein [Aerobium aerolatum]|uniref:Helix-turn-helix domain-containing protein n=1 Tax=Aquamicrobium aerolatum DSM 21857 TaxID=1121003 RepID=A0A1I3HDG1_9HYPH|nr:helix-turn-helix transcriptional regulator [Aquamicrobium aerolatum]SFI33681.1 Helix-turn-helix domain-containing protein [Aquamicrobium aerolatum DSM 21857]